MSLKFYVILVTLLGSCLTAFYFLRSKTDSDIPTALKMAGGPLAKIISFPHHVQYGPECNGAIIGIWWMIAPANCPFYDYVRVGSQYRDHGRNKKISRRVTHPKFRNTSNRHILEYNFQLMKFAKKINSDDCAAPIAVSLMQKDDLDENVWLAVSGFGEGYLNGPLSNLRQIAVKRQKDSTCEGPTHPFLRRNLSGTLICAGTFQGGLDACSGDIGGGMVFKKALVALLLHGQGCHEVTGTLAIEGPRFSLYGLMSPLIKWIRNVTSSEKDVKFIFEKP